MLEVNMIPSQCSGRTSRWGNWNWGMHGDDGKELLDVDVSLEEVLKLTKECSKKTVGDDILLEVKRILDEIAATSGRIDKENILKAHKHNEKLKEVLQFLYCDLITTGLSEKKLSKDVGNLMFAHSVGNLMDYLKSNNTGTDTNILSVQRFISCQPLELQEFYRLLATKNLKIGITKSTCNKIFGKGFIADFKVMLADRFDKHEDKVKGEFLLTLKLDGIRNVLTKENGKVTMRTRQGKLVTGLIDIEKEAELLPDNMVLDGELILRNDKGLNSADLFRETMKVVRKDGIKKNVEFHVFDMLPVSEFKQGKSSLGALDRKAELKALLDDLQPSWIKEVPILYQGNNKDVIPELLDKVEKEGFEGLVLNTSRGLYTNKRSRELLKIKTFFTADVKVLQVLEGTNRNAGRLGAITVQFEHKGKLYECNCGSGFSDQERVLYYEQPELLLGKIVEIGYFEISENQEGGVGLRFPTWKGIIRSDKSEISMY